MHAVQVRDTAARRAHGFACATRTERQRAIVQVQLAVAVKVHDYVNDHDDDLPPAATPH
jgi:hypothetical protein